MRAMRTLQPALLALALACLALACSAQPPKSPANAQPVHGIETADLDRNVAPCDDFYQFANGTWRANNPIPSYMDRWSRRWQAGEINKERLTQILTELSGKTDWPARSVEQQVGDFYASCMAEPAIDAAGATPLAATFAVIDAAKDAKALEAVITELHAQRLGVLFVIFSSPDVHDPSRTLANILAGGLGLPDRDYYFKEEPRFAEARERYKKHVARMFVLLGRPESDAQGAAESVFALESRLAGATLDNVARRDPNNLDHPTEFADLQKLTPAFDWGAYFDAAHMPRSQLNVMEPAFLTQMQHELSETPIAELRTYLTFHVLEDSAQWLSKPFVDEWFDFQRRYLLGVNEMKPRSTRCAELVDELLGEAAGQKYVERYFSPAAKAKAEELVKNELAAMKTILGNLGWMSPETKQKALEKLASFTFKVGYPDTWLDYSSVIISRAAFFPNVIEGRKFVVADDRAQVGKPTDRKRWGMTPPTSNAYCNFELNEIVFPAGILQPPAFDVNASDAVNYGAIGYVIGHEISHAFDDQGAKFDATGRLRNWWTDADYKAFAARGQCVVDQFEGYFIEPGIHHNGKLVLGESIGDLAGLRVSYLAFKTAHEKNPQPTNSGLTAEQEFFVSLGQFRGDETRPETMRNMIQGDEHPVAKFRVIGPLSNLPAFQETFSCPANAPMVRPEAQRCQVW
jgi:putative endopeptidase